MPTKVAALVRLDAQAAGLGDLTRALDAQTLSATDFEVVVIAAGLDQRGRDQVLDLTRRRPNFRLVDGEVADAVEQTSAEWLTTLSGHDSTLRPATLERLVERAETTGSDVVLGRVDLSGGRELVDVLARDTEKVTVPTSTVLSAIVLERRAVAVAHGPIVDEASAQQMLAAASSVATLGSYQCATRPSGGADGPPSHIAVDSASAAWRDGALVVDVRGAVEPGTQGDVLIAVRSVGAKTDYWLPTSGSVDADGTFRATAQCDPASAAEGAPLTDGHWTFTVGVHGNEPRPSARQPMPSVTGLQSAIVDGRPIVAVAAGSSLVLDVGATKSSIVGGVAATDVAIEETARGTLLRARLPHVVGSDGPAAEGQLLLDKFALPARIVPGVEASTLECYLSGLAGRSHLSSRFGRAATSLALELGISATGQMTVRRQAPPAPAKKAAAKAGAGQAAPGKATAAKRAAVPPPRRGAVQRVRRALPKRLDPAIAKMSRNRTVAGLYRKAAGLPPR